MPNYDLATLTREAGVPKLNDDLHSMANRFMEVDDDSVSPGGPPPSAPSPQPSAQAPARLGARTAPNSVVKDRIIADNYSVNIAENYSINIDEQELLAASLMTDASDNVAEVVHYKFDTKAYDRRMALKVHRMLFGDDDTEWKGSKGKKSKTEDKGKGKGKKKKPESDDSDSDESEPLIKKRKKRKSRRSLIIYDQSIFDTSSDSD